jgi:hypothetical protein
MNANPLFATSDTPRPTLILGYGIACDVVEPTGWCTQLREMTRELR